MRPETAAIAQALGRVHRHKTWKPLRIAPNGSDELVRDVQTISALCPDQALPDLPTYFVAPTPKTTVIHADPVLSNFVGSPDSPVLIDWQCPARGDPVEDIAVFLSTAMQVLYTGEPLTSAQVDAFRTAYPDPETVARYDLLRPFYSARMIAYCQWQVARGGAVYKRPLEAELDIFHSVA